MAHSEKGWCLHCKAVNFLAIRRLEIASVCPWLSLLNASCVIICCCHSCRSSLWEKRCNIARRQSGNFLPLQLFSVQWSVVYFVNAGHWLTPSWSLHAVDCADHIVKDTANIYSQFTFCCRRLQVFSNLNSHKMVIFDVGDSCDEFEFHWSVQIINIHLMQVIVVLSGCQCHWQDQSISA